MEALAQGRFYRLFDLGGHLYEASDGAQQPSQARSRPQHFAHARIVACHLLAGAAQQIQSVGQAITLTARLRYRLFCKRSLLRRLGALKLQVLEASL